MVFAIHQHESAMSKCVSTPSWTSLPHPSPLYSSGLSQSAGFGCPASSIELAQVISLTYVSLLFFQIIPPSPSPTECKSLFLSSVSPLLPCSRIVGTIFLSSIHMCYYTVFVFLFPTYSVCWWGVVYLSISSIRVGWYKDDFGKNSTSRKWGKGITAGRSSSMSKVTKGEKRRQTWEPGGREWRGEWQGLGRVLRTSYALLFQGIWSCPRRCCSQRRRLSHWKVNQLAGWWWRWD